MRFGIRRILLVLRGLRPASLDSVHFGLIATLPFAAALSLGGCATATEGPESSKSASTEQPIAVDGEEVDDVGDAEDEEGEGGDAYGPEEGPGYGPEEGAGYGPEEGAGPGYGVGYGPGYAVGYGPGYGPGYGAVYVPGYGVGYGAGYGVGYGAGYGRTTVWRSESGSACDAFGCVYW